MNGRWRCIGVGDRPQGGVGGDDRVIVGPRRLAAVDRQERGRPRPEAGAMHLGVDDARAIWRPARLRGAGVVLAIVGEPLDVGAIGLDGEQVDLDGDVLEGPEVERVEDDQRAVRRPIRVGGVGVELGQPTLAAAFQVADEDGRPGQWLGKILEARVDQRVSSGEMRGCSAVMPSCRVSTTSTCPVARSSRATWKVRGIPLACASASWPK